MVATAPISAASTNSCATSRTGTVCQSPGNVQINDSPPAVQFYPYGGEAFLTGGGGTVSTAGGGVGSVGGLGASGGAHDGHR
jgi:hypothetical protein